MNAHDPKPPSGETVIDPNARDNETSHPQITIITKTDIPSVMSKRISVGSDGKLISDGSECRMTSGKAERAAVQSPHELARIICDCGQDQAIALGALRGNIFAPANITTKRRLKGDLSGAIARSREFIDYRTGYPAYVLFDFDTKNMPNEVRAKISAVDGFWESVLIVAPELAKAARVSRLSTSAGLFRSDTQEPVAGSDGAHHYVLVIDGGDAERFLKDLHDRCWLHGFGWYIIGSAGQLLERSIIDRMVGFGERLCFEGAPILVSPLAQDAVKRIPKVFHGEAIRSDRAVPQLTEYEQHRVREVKARAAKTLGKEAKEIRNKHDKALAQKIVAKAGLPMATALRQVKALHRGVLGPNVELQFDHAGSVSVESVLNDPNRYAGETLADPLEGVGYGRGKAIVIIGDDGQLLIHSFAHGRGLYHLKHNLESATVAFEQAPADAKVDQAMAILAQAELEENEVDEFVAVIKKETGAGVRALKARIKKERIEREIEKRAASVRLAEEADGRIVQPCPDFNGELLPVITFLNTVLVNDQGDEPPMRNASGALVRVEEKKPWALHLLTSDGANAADENAESVQAPAEPVLIELTTTGTEFLLEKYFRWVATRKDRSTYFAVLPSPYIVALMEDPNSTLPIVRAINTAPLVTLSGRVIDGIGLDRETGLVHRIDPVLRAALPPGDVTEEEIRQALTFLLDEWLVDVALDRAGKCVAIMLALTVLQRALLPERPAYFISAGQRGGGKTTLIMMIIAAVLGRRAAAASWSDNVEERKKALFSYLRQSVAALIWDNITRGKTITCPHIEAAITSAEMSDRVLGVSRVETVATTTIQIFTGNMIGPRGDMASRSLSMVLDVDRPDPENRDFKNPDPLAWTQQNRIKILNALYTILKGGVLHRPAAQTAKTRFKLWWGLIGWSVEFAASLLDIKLDCTELLRAGEAQDEEAGALCRAMTIFYKRWGTKMFTAQQVVLTLGAADSLIEESAEQAQELAGALGELAEKAIDKPTAQAIGKLFQKHLTDRPVFLVDGTIAILRRDKQHQANRYKIEVKGLTEHEQANDCSDAEIPETDTVF